MRSSISFAWFIERKNIFEQLTFLDDSNDDTWIGWGDRRWKEKKDRKSIINKK